MALMIGARAPKLMPKGGTKTYNSQSMDFNVQTAGGEKMQEQEFIESRDEMEKLLKEEAVGYLGLCLKDEPYVVPLNYCYFDGKLLFHCGFKGKKLDYLRANGHVCFSVGRQRAEVREHGGEDPCHVDSDSVLCYGTARVIEDVGGRQAALNAFNHRFRPEAPDVPVERVINCCMVEIAICEMTGRRERERKRTCWRYTFSPAPAQRK